MKFDFKCIGRKIIAGNPVNNSPPNICIRNFGQNDAT